MEQGLPVTLVSVSYSVQHRRQGTHRYGYLYIRGKGTIGLLNRNVAFHQGGGPLPAQSGVERVEQAIRSIVKEGGKTYCKKQQSLS